MISINDVEWRRFVTANIVMLIDITPESFPNFKVTILEKQEMRSVFLECGVKVSIHRTRSYETVYVYLYIWLLC